MSLPSKPTENLIEWNPTDPDSMVEPSGAKKSMGYVPKEPFPAQHQNWILKSISVWFSWIVSIVDLLVRGVPYWQDNVTYQVNDLVNFNGKIYRSLAINNLGNDPVDEAYWEAPVPFFEANYYFNKFIPLAPYVLGSFGDSSHRSWFLSSGGSISKIKFTPDGNHVIYIGPYTDSSYMSMHSRLLQYGSDPNASVPISAQPNGECHGFDTSLDGKYLVLVGNTTPFVHTYEKRGHVYTKLPNPTTLPPASTFMSSVAMSRDGMLFAYVGVNAGDASGRFGVYKWGNVGNITFQRITNPSDMPANYDFQAVKFTPDNKYLICAGGVGFAIYKITRDVSEGFSLERIVLNTNYPISTVESLDVHPNENIFVLNSDPVNYVGHIHLFRINGDDTVTRIDDGDAQRWFGQEEYFSGSLPTSNNLCFTPDGRYLSVCLWDFDASETRYFLLRLDKSSTPDYSMELHDVDCPSFTQTGNGFRQDFSPDMTMWFIMESRFSAVVARCWDRNEDFSPKGSPKTRYFFNHGGGY